MLRLEELPDHLLSWSRTFLVGPHCIHSTDLPSETSPHHSLLLLNRRDRSLLFSLYLDLRTLLLSLLIRVRFPMLIHHLRVSPFLNRLFCERLERRLLLRAWFLHQFHSAPLLLQLLTEIIPVSFQDLKSRSKLLISLDLVSQFRRCFIVDSVLLTFELTQCCFQIFTLSLSSIFESDL